MSRTAQKAGRTLLCGTIIFTQGYYLNTVFSQLLMVSGFKGPWSLYAIVIASYKWTDACTRVSPSMCMEWGRNGGRL